MGQGQRELDLVGHLRISTSASRKESGCPAGSSRDEAESRHDDDLQTVLDDELEYELVAGRCRDVTRSHDAAGHHRVRSFGTSDDTRE